LDKFPLGVMAHFCPIVTPSYDLRPSWFTTSKMSALQPHIELATSRDSHALWVQWIY